MAVMNLEARSCVDLVVAVSGGPLMCSMRSCKSSVLASAAYRRQKDGWMFYESNLM